MLNLTPTQAALLQRGLDHLLEHPDHVLESDLRRVAWVLAQMATRQAAEANDLAAMQAASDLAQAANPPAGYITLAEAAKLCGLKPVTLRYYVTRGDLLATKRDGRNWWVDVHDFWLWMSERGDRK